MASGTAKTHTVTTWHACEGQHSTDTFKLQQSLELACRHGSSSLTQVDMHLQDAKPASGAF